MAKKKTAPLLSDDVELKEQSALTETPAEEIPAEDNPIADAAAEDMPAEAITAEGSSAEDAAEDIPANGVPVENTAADEEVFSGDNSDGEADIGDESEGHDDYAALLQELREGDHSHAEEAPLVLDEPPSTFPDDDLHGDEEPPLPDDEPDTTGNNDISNDARAPRPAARRSAADARRRERILTIDARDEVQTEEDREAIIWHEIQNSQRTRRMLTGTLDGVEKTDSGLILAVANYKGFRVAIPIREMLLEPENDENKRYYVPDYKEQMDRLYRILNARLGSEIDFIVKGCDSKSRSVVGSRKEAMYRKRQSFYLDTNELGEHLIYEGRVVQARVVGVAEKIIRVEVFGVETSIVARGLSWEWIGNARDHFSVGDRILVRVLKINRSSLKGMTIQVDVRSVSSTTSHDNLKNCLPQCKYAGRVTDVRNGVVFIRLNNGVNAIAHSCYDTRYPGKKDDVSFAVTRIDEEQGVAVGIITRIIKQNL